MPSRLEKASFDNHWSVAPMDEVLRSRSPRVSLRASPKSTQLEVRYIDHTRPSRQVYNTCDNTSRLLISILMGLLQVQVWWKVDGGDTFVEGFRKYFYAKEKSSDIHAAVIRNDVNITPLKLAQKQHEHPEVAEDAARRSEGGRGIPKATHQHTQQVENLRKYFYAKEKSSDIHAAVIRNDVNITPLKLAQKQHEHPEVAEDAAHVMRRQWMEKPLHGKTETVVLGDINAKSPMWGAPIVDNKGTYWTEKISVGTSTETYGATPTKSSQKSSTS
ncbi:hypothetical protein QE152_g40649 [Popillia japonica]|uniref:Endonuclease/exonuclease/phosphatase domain-containing protein n=1 Tax=Popillia japonica TaxID=7064 RepID=A0AAW1HFK4_POPJA